MISAPGLLVALCCVFSLVENEVDAAITVDSFRTYKAPGTALTWTWTTLQPNGEFRFDVDNLEPGNHRWSYTLNRDGQQIAEDENCRSTCTLELSNMPGGNYVMDMVARGGDVDWLGSIIGVDCFCAPTEVRTQNCSLVVGSSATVQCAECPAGNFCNGDGTNETCPAGHYCPAGTTLDSRFTRKCDPGFYCEEGQSLSTGNGPCLAGRFCSSGSVNNTGDGPCTGGYFCPEGSSTPTGSGICADGTYCLPGATSPVLCPEGRQCPEGTATFEGTPCPIGNSCPEGSGAAFICAEGFQRIVNTTSCKVCDDGFYCDGGGTEGNRMPCPAGFFCSGGSLSPCDPLRFCPVGSVAEGPLCLNQGTSSFGGSCECFEFFSGLLCDHTTSVVTGGNVSIVSAQFEDQAIQFLRNDTIIPCGCDAFFDGEACVSVPNGVLFLSQLYVAGIEAYQNNTYDLSIHAFAKASMCSYLQDWSTSAASLTSILEQIRNYLLSRRADAVTTVGLVDEIAFTQLLVNTEHLLSLSDPSAYSVPFEFGSVTDADKFYFAHTPAFKFCTTAGLQQFIDDCGENIEEVLSLARCGLLRTEDLSNTLVSQEMFVSQAIYCVRSIRSLVQDEYDIERVNLALGIIVEAASTVEENYGPSDSTAQLVKFAKSAATTFKSDFEDRTIPVPVQPVLFFENNFASKIQEIQAFAAKLGRDQRAAAVSGQISAFETRISSEIGAGFSNLTGLLLDVNVGVQQQFEANAVLNAQVAQGELEALLDTWKTEIDRITASLSKFSEHVTLLSGDRVTALLEGLEELVEIQFERDSAIVALAKAQATLDLIKNVFSGLVAIGLSLIGFPMVGIVAAAAVQAIPLRRRLEKKEEEEDVDLGLPIHPNRGEGHQRLGLVPGVTSPRPQPRTSKGRRLNTGCREALPMDGLSFIERLGQKGAAFAMRVKSQLSGKPQLTDLVGKAVRLTALGFDAALLGKGCLNAAEEESREANNFVADLLLLQKKRAIFSVYFAFQISGFDPDEESNEIKEIMEPFLACNATGRRLRAKVRRKLNACNKVTNFARNTRQSGQFARSLWQKTLGGVKRVGSVVSSISNRALGVASGVFDIALGFQQFFQQQAAANAFAALAAETEQSNLQNVNAAIGTLRDSLLQINFAFLSVIARLDHIQLGFSYDDMAAAGDEFVDAFKFLPVFWEDIFTNVMDVLEYEALICPQIDEQPLIKSAGEAFKKALDESNSGARSLAEVMAERLAEQETTKEATPRRSLFLKAEKKAAQAQLKAANQRFKEVLERMENVECRRFERTLRSAIDWGKAIHESVFAVMQKYREFERLVDKQDLAKARANATGAALGRATQRNADFLNSLPTAQAQRAEIEAYASAAGMLESELQIMSVVDEVTATLREFCSAHVYINPEDRPAACTVDLFELERESSTVEEFLLSIASTINSLITASSRDWFELAYSSFSQYDDELLDVTELIDMEQFRDSGYQQISFALNGPPENAYGTNPLNVVDLRNGPYFCNYDNIGMTSFGLIFLDGDGNIIADEDVEIGVSVTLSGPFFKTIGGTRKGFSLRAYEDVIYRYSRPKTLEGARYCRTDETPTLFGQICDKGRSFEIETDGLNSQPLPSPYAKWDVKVTQGAGLLASKSVAGVKLITTFNAIRNEDMLCRGERQDYLFVAQSSSSSTGAPATPPGEVVVFDGRDVGIIVFVCMIPVAVLVFLLYKRWNKSEQVQPNNNQEEPNALNILEPEAGQNHEDQEPIQNHHVQAANQNNEVQTTFGAGAEFREDRRSTTGRPTRRKGPQPRVSNDEAARKIVNLFEDMKEQVLALRVT